MKVTPSEWFSKCTGAFSNLSWRHTDQWQKHYFKATHPVSSWSPFAKELSKKKKTVTTSLITAVKIALVTSLEIYINPCFSRLTKLYRFELLQKAHLRQKLVPDVQEAFNRNLSHQRSQLCTRADFKLIKTQKRYNQIDDIEVQVDTLGGKQSSY